MDKGRNCPGSSTACGGFDGLQHGQVTGYHTRERDARRKLVALTISTFMGNWQSFMWPLLVIDSEALFTLPVGLSYLQEQYQFASPNWPLIMTGSLIALLPIMVVFVFTQRFFLQGIRMGSGGQGGK